MSLKDWFKNPQNVMMTASVLIAFFSASVAFFSWRLSADSKKPELSLIFDNDQGGLQLKNYGEFSARNARVVYRQLEFGDKLKIGNVKRSGGDSVFGKEEILVPVQYDFDLTNHAQFLICIWSYGTVWIHRSDRVFVRLPDQKKWVTTLQPFVDQGQWETVTHQMNLLKKNYKKICEVQQGKPITFKLE